MISSWKYGPILDSKIRHPPKKQFKADGSPSAQLLKYAEAHDYAVGYCASTKQYKLYRYLPGAHSVRNLPLTEPLETTSIILLNEHQRLKDHFVSIGWKPTMTTESGNPRLINSLTKEPCPNLAKIADPDLLEAIVQHAIVNSRLSMIGGEKTGLLSNVDYSGDETGLERRIFHDANTLGTNTGRFTHKKIVNIPRVATPYGHMIRELFLPDYGNVMVGWDASSLEARIEAHYVYPFDPDYADSLVAGDPHTELMEKLGLKSRDDAKKLKYMITYGAQPPKIADSLGVSWAKAREWFNGFWEIRQGLKQLILHINKEWEAYDTTYIKGLDGRLLSTRAPHTLLNTKLQGGGAILMKHALLIAEKRARSRCPGARPLIRYHDEEQWSCPAHHASALGEIGVKSIVDAGVYLKLNVPMDAEYKIGNNWSETH